MVKLSLNKHLQLRLSKIKKLNGVCPWWCNQLKNSTSKRNKIHKEATKNFFESARSKEFEIEKGKKRFTIINSKTDSRKVDKLLNYLKVQQIHLVKQ